MFVFHSDKQSLCALTNAAFLYVQPENVNFDQKKTFNILNP